MRKIITITYISGIHALLLIVLLKSNFIDKALLKLELKQPPEITHHYENMMRYHVYIDSQPLNQSVLFLGDSITQGLNTALITDKGVNFGIGADTTLGLIGRIDKYENTIKNSEVVIIAIGINDIERRPNHEIIKNYEEILKRIPNKKIIISSVLPVDESIKRFAVLSMNDRVNELNNSLLSLSKMHPNITFLNAYKLLVDKTGNLPSYYHVGDGVHLNAEGYSVWSQALKVAIQSIRKAP